MFRRLFLLSALAVPTLSLGCSAGGNGDEGDATANDGGTPDGFSGFDMDGGSTDFGGKNCGSSTFANEVPGALLIVLDKSGSMSSTPDGSDTGTSKWTYTASALGNMLAGMPAELPVGLLPYPKGDWDEPAACALQESTFMMNCGQSGFSQECLDALANGGCLDVDSVAAVPVAPASTSKAQIESWISAHGPGGMTPTRRGLLSGYDIIRAYQHDGPRFVLLITDGMPTTRDEDDTMTNPLCNPPEFPMPPANVECGMLTDIENDVLNAANGSPPVSTFVIGSPGSENAAEHLSTLALNGNTAKDSNCSALAGNCHYQIGSTNFQDELEQVLAKIAGVISDCIFDIPTGNEEVDPNMVNVVVETADGKQEIYMDPLHQDGWDYTDPSHDKIQLFGPACEKYKQSKGNAVTIILGCETVLK